MVLPENFALTSPLPALGDICAVLPNASIAGGG